MHDVDAVKVRDSFDDLFEHATSRNFSALAVWLLPHVLLE
jgi:hypothetical protein